MYARKSSIYLLLLCVPFISFLFIFFFFGSNIPFEDDIRILHSVLIDLPDASGLSRKITLFFHPHNEHPVVMYKLAIWVYHFIFSGINIKTINLIGNLLFLLSFVFFYRQLKIIKASWTWLIPIPYIILSLFSYENALWALCSFQHTAILTFFIGGLYYCVLYRENTSRFYLGLFFLLCTSLSSGNGFLGFIIVFVTLLFEKRFKSALIVGILLGLVKYFILNGLPFHQPMAFQEILRSLSILSGSIIETSEKTYIVFLLGIIVLSTISLFVLYTFFAKHTREDRLYFIITSGICLFVIGTFLGLAAFRPIRSSEFADRYRVYTHLLWVGLYLFLIPFFIKSNFRQYFSRLAIVGGVFYILYSFYSAFPRVLIAYHQRQAISFNYYNANTCFSGCSHMDYFDKTFNILADKNSYHLPPPIYSYNGVESSPLISALKVKSMNAETLSLASETGNYAMEGAIFLLLTNSRNSSMLVPVLNMRNRQFLRPDNSFFKGFRVELPKKCYPEDIYTISIATWKNDKFVVSKSTFLFDNRQSPALSN